MVKAVEFLDCSIEMLFIESGLSLKDGLGKEFKAVFKKFLKGANKDFYKAKIEQQYDDTISFYGDFDDYSLEDLIDEFSLSEDDDLVKEYKGKEFNVRALSVFDEDEHFGCLVIDPSKSVYAGVKKIISMGKESFYYAFKRNGEFKVVALLTLE